MSCKIPNNSKDSQCLQCRPFQRNELNEFIASVKPLRSGFVFDNLADPRYQSINLLKQRFGSFLHTASVRLAVDGDENSVDAILMLVSPFEVGVFK